jgi:glycosyltransferase involved in cell wall biosynthesis
MGTGTGDGAGRSNSRVLLVVGHSTGGIGGHVASLVAGLPALGWTPTVATSAATAERFDLGPAVEVVWPSGGPVTTARRLRRLRQLVGRADVVHAHGHQAGLLTVAVAATLPRRRRPRVAVSWHNAVLGGGFGRRVRVLLERVQARRADLLTGASSDLVDRARALGADDVRLAPVAAPAAGTWRGERGPGRAALADELGLEAGAPWLLTVSRIAPQKHLGVLVDAAARLARDTHLVWLVAGDGDRDLLARLEAAVARTGAPVRFLGARRDVVRLMALADLFVLPSAWEARALVVQEAMAAGTPVVATAVGGLPDLLDGTGVLVPPGNAPALAAAVARLLADPAEAARLGAAGRARFAALPGEDDVLADWAQTYARLAARRGA